MKYEVISGPIAIDATTMAQTGDVIILDEADGKPLVQYQILKVADEDAIAINDPNPPSTDKKVAAKVTETAKATSEAAKT
jgi:hypothetical protein